MPDVIPTPPAFPGNLPVTVRRSIEVLGLLALGFLFVWGQSIFMPLLMAVFISLLLLPPFRWMTKRGVPEVLAIVLCILLFFVVIAGVVYFLSTQIGALLKDIDAIRQNLTSHWNNLSGWINEKLHYTSAQQVAILNKQGARLGQNVAGYLQGAALSLTNILVFVGLVPVYIFLILFYRNLLLRFAFLWFAPAEHARVGEAIRETEAIVKYYLVGLAIQIGYLTVLVGGILLIFGIKHAILIGVTFAILNLIPYVGALLGNLIGVVLTLTSSQELSQIWIVLGTIAAVQFLDNNILMPRIVGSKVKVNALASIVGIVLGGTLAGVAGMFLSIPVMAVLKIMFDKSEPLRKWGVLLGDDRPERSPMSRRFFMGGKRKPNDSADTSVKKKLAADRDAEVSKEIQKEVTRDNSGDASSKPE